MTTIIALCHSILLIKQITNHSLHHPDGNELTWIFLNVFALSRLLSCSIMQSEHLPT